tara:strand:+ start:717 stop:1058 length:342 start_codon:yes stop_codon:yes gene_type:complete
MATNVKLRFDQPLDPKFWGDEEVINIDNWSVVTNKKKNIVHVKKEAEYTGKVTNWFNKKGYGFIKSNNNTKPIFCHQKQIKKEGFRYLERGSFVKFQIKKISKGFEAINVQEL